MGGPRTVCGALLLLVGAGCWRLWLDGLALPHGMLSAAASSAATPFPSDVPHVLPQNLSMESMHGSGAALHPLRGATALTRLRLAACHFESGALLGEALAGVVQPGGRGGAPGLKSLELEGCGVQSAVVAALTQALDGSGTQGSGGSSAIVVSPRERRTLLLRELRVELKWRVGQNAGQALAHAVAQCTQVSARRHSNALAPSVA